MPGQLFRLLFCLFVLITFFNASVQSQGSILQLNENISDQLPQLAYGDILLGDYDADGDPDILISGEGEHINGSFLYRNEGFSNFNEIILGFPPLQLPDLSWNDFDNDGDLDIFLSGARESGDTLYPESYLYEYDKGSYALLETSIRGVYSGCSAWADLDLDGDQDLIISGATGKSENGWITYASCWIYRNDGSGQFSETETGIKGVFNANIDIADYDNDHYPDVVMTGELFDDASAWHRSTHLYHNESDLEFTHFDIGMPELRGADIIFGDYNNDGFSDILMSGDPVSPVNLVYIFKNDTEGNFYDIGIEILGTADGSVKWADYDNDGDLDFVLTGLQYPSADHPVSEVYRNSGNDLFSFDSFIEVEGLMFSSVCWGDMDQDHDPDLILMGYTEKGMNDARTLVYDNISIVQNNLPLPPSQIDTDVNGNEVTLSWNAGFDPETAATGLSYNLRIGTSPEGTDILSPLSLGNGLRQVFSSGNAYQSLSKTINGLENNTYYWSVQAIDHSFGGSAFSVEETFNIISTGEAEQSLHKKISLHVYPNPLKENLNIMIDSHVRSTADLQLLNAAGRLILERRGILIEKGRNDILLNCGDISNGLYFLHISGNDISAHRKVIRSQP